MSYNIDNWKTKKIDNLIIPIKALYEHEREDFHPSKPELDIKTGKVSIDCFEGEIKGTLNNGLLTVEKIQIYGEGSGTIFGNVIKPALQQSKGELEAILVWERGDTIEKLIVIDGYVEETPIDL